MKTIVITGSSRGIGFFMAKEFIKKGCNVTISGKNPENLETVKKEFTKFSNNTLYVLCDVTKKKMSKT